MAGDSIRMEWLAFPSRKKMRCYAFPLFFEDGVVGMQAFKQLQLFFSQTVFTVHIVGWKRS